MSYEEAELIKKAKKNDVEAFETLISQYTTPLLGYIFKILSNREDAEDALQETYIKAFNAMQSFEGDSSFKTWLYRIATNVCFDELRKRKRRNTVSLNKVSEEGEYEIIIPDETYSPEIVAKKRAALDALMAAMDKLNVDQRTVISLRDIDGFSYDEIAKVTSSSVGTVKSRINRARLMLKNFLEKDKELFT